MSLHINEHGPYVGADGVWGQVIQPAARGDKKRPALFLDRDGVVNEDVGYLHSPQDVRLIRGAGRVINAANRLGFAVVIVTNQGGIGLRLYDWQDFEMVQERIYERLATERAVIDGVFASPYHPRGVNEYAHPDHPSRKPNPGMFLIAARWLNIDLSRSWIIGDHYRDLVAGKKAGLAGGMHVLSGHGSHEGQREGALALADDGFRVVTGFSITAALHELPLFLDRQTDRPE